MNVCRSSELHILRWSFPGGKVLRGLAGFWRLFHLCREVQRKRAALRYLDDRILKDIGISRVDALREASRPFGDVDLAGLDRLSGR